MTELYYPPKTQDTYNDSQQIIESYEKELAEDGKTKAERDRKELLRCQNAELFEIENKFDNPDCLDQDCLKGSCRTLVY